LPDRSVIVNPVAHPNLPCHVLIKVLPWLLSRKTIGKLGVKPFELLHKVGNISFVDQQFRYGKATIINSIFRYHGRPSVLGFEKQVAESGLFANRLFYYV